MQYFKLESTYTSIERHENSHVLSKPFRLHCPSRSLTLIQVSTTEFYILVIICIIWDIYLESLLYSPCAVLYLYSPVKCGSHHKWLPVSDSVAKRIEQNVVVTMGQISRCNAYWCDSHITLRPFCATSCLKYCCPTGAEVSEQEKPWWYKSYKCLTGLDLATHHSL